MILETIRFEDHGEAEFPDRYDCICAYVDITFIKAIDKGITTTLTNVWAMSIVLSYVRN